MSEPTGQTSAGRPGQRWGSLLLAGWLVVMWTALWGAPTVANLLGGAAVAAGVLWVFPRERVDSRVALRPVHATLFLVWFMGQLVSSSLRVAWLIVKPSGPSEMEPGIVATPIRGMSDLLTTMVANSITLTPGTLTVEVSREPSVIYVHAIEAQSPDEIRAQVLDLERRLVVAFGSRDARNALDEASIPPIGEVRR
ncbi:MAG: Na+/H+ antiporter subunit E [Candidatus Microthrix subdominans]